jgi:hypothetical protein
MGNPGPHLERITSQLAAFERLIESGPATLDRRAPRVSGWSVRLQVDHVLKVLALGHLTLANGYGKQLSRCNLLGRCLLFADWIPRGVGKSPARVVPVEKAEAELLAEARRLRGLFADPALARSPRFADATPVFPHPYFGGLDATQGARFLGTHTHHHWKIVRDILRAAKGDL